MKYLMAIICLLLAACQANAQSRQDASPGGWASFAMGYYKNPEPQRVSEIMAAMAKSEHPLAGSSAAPAIVFFSYVFAANPAMKPDWEKQIASLGGQVGRLMNEAIHTPPETILAAIPPSPVRNDALWTCFFATGKRQCVNELIESLDDMGYPSSERAFPIGWTAKWSLASNMQSNPLVREAIESSARSGSPEVRMQCQSILMTSPGAIRSQGGFILRNVLKGSDMPDSIWAHGNHLTEYVTSGGEKFQLRFEIWIHDPSDLHIAMLDPSKGGGGKPASGAMLLIDGRFLATHDIDTAPSRPIDDIDMPILMERLATQLLARAFPAGAPVQPELQQVTVAEPLKSLNVATLSARAEYSAPWTATAKVSRDSTDRVHYQLDLDPTDPRTGQPASPIEITGTWEQLKSNPDTPASMSLEGWKVYSIDQTAQPLGSGQIVVDYRATPLEAEVRTVGDLRTFGGVTKQLSQPGSGESLPLQR